MTQRRLRSRTLLLVGLALLYQLSTASRAGAMGLVCGLIGIAWLARGRWSLRSMLLGALGAVLTFSLAAIAVNRVSDVGETVAGNAERVAELGLLYGVGPIVAFERAFMHPEEASTSSSS